MGTNIGMIHGCSFLTRALLPGFLMAVFFLHKPYFFIRIFVVVSRMINVIKSMISESTNLYSYSFTNAGVPLISTIHKQGVRRLDFGGTTLCQPQLGFPNGAAGWI